MLLNVSHIYSRCETTIKSSCSLPLTSALNNCTTDFVLTNSSVSWEKIQSEAVILLFSTILAVTARPVIRFITSLAFTSLSPVVKGLCPKSVVNLNRVLML